VTRHCLLSTSLGAVVFINDGLMLQVTKARCQASETQLLILKARRCYGTSDRVKSMSSADARRHVNQVRVCTM
jgi:hypothetical protein